MRPLFGLILLIAVVFTACGPSDQDLVDAIDEHMVRVGMARGNDYHALKIEILSKSDEKDKALEVVAAVSGGISPSGADEGTVVPSPFADTLRVTIAEVDGRWEVRGPASN